MEILKASLTKSPQLGFSFNLSTAQGWGNISVGPIVVEAKVARGL